MGQRTYELTVASGATTSNVMPLKYVSSFSVQAPTGLAEVATLQVSNNGTVWDTIDPTSVTVAADNIEEVTGVSSAYLRVSLGGAAAAARTFIVSVIENYGI